jgi:hypothetical protein
MYIPPKNEIQKAEGKVEFHQDNTRLLLLTHAKEPRIPDEIQRTGVEHQSRQ